MEDESPLPKDVPVYTEISLLSVLFYRLLREVQGTLFWSIKDEKPTSNPVSRNVRKV